MDSAPQQSAVSLRPATSDDVAAIVSLEKRLQKAPWAEENIRSELAKPYCRFLVLTDDETDSRISGYIVFWLMFDECHVLNVLVDEPLRGRGFGKRMIRVAVTEAIKKETKKILLEVRKSNAPAIGLYQSSGFVITHVRKGFYSDGEDAYLMALYLDDPAASVRF